MEALALKVFSSLQDQPVLIAKEAPVPLDCCSCCLLEDAHSCIAEEFVQAVDTTVQDDFGSFKNYHFKT